MERDLKFEVQYLLSLTLVVFGLLSVETFRTSIDPWIGYGVILLLSIHFSIFNLSYGFSEGLPYSIDFLDELRQWSRPLLFLVSVGFTYFIGHTVHALINEHIISNFSSVPHVWVIFIEYVMPILYIGVMVIAYNNKVRNTIQDMEDINIKIIPHSIRVFPTRDDTKALTVKIENEGDDAFEFELGINVPQEVHLWEDAEPIEEYYTASGAVDPGRAFRKSFNLSHEAIRRVTDIITVTVEFEGGTKEQEVELDLVS